MHGNRLAPHVTDLTAAKSFVVKLTLAPHPPHPTTDSRSYLQALQKQILNSPKVRKLKNTIANLLKLGKTVELCWMPGHTGNLGDGITNKNKTKKYQDDKKKSSHVPIKTCFHLSMTPYMKNGTLSEMRKTTNLNKL